MHVSGVWDCVMTSPLGKHAMAVTIAEQGGTFSGSADTEFGVLPIDHGDVDGDTLKWTMAIKHPVDIKLDFVVQVAGDTATGKANTTLLGSFPISGHRRV